MVTPGAVGEVNLLRQLGVRATVAADDADALPRVVATAVADRGRLDEGDADPSGQVPRPSATEWSCRPRKFEAPKVEALYKEMVK